MSSIDNAITHIRDLLMQDKPLGTSHAQNKNATAVTGTDWVEVLAAADPGFRYELVEFVATNETGGESPILELGDGSHVYWRCLVGDPLLGSGQAEKTFTPRRIWPENTAIKARLLASGGSVKVYASAYKARIQPGSEDIALDTAGS